MRTKTVLALATVLVLIVGMAAVASNMGFKINLALTSGGDLNWVALPLYNSYTDASSVWADLTNPSQISRWDNATGTYQTYLGTTRSNNFTLNKGEGIVVKVSAAENWIVVGSHDPSFAFSLTAGGDLNWVAVPYNETATDASGIWGELTNPSQISRWDNATGTYQTYLGTTRSNNFTLNTGEAIVVKVSANESWTPAHY